MASPTDSDPLTASILERRYQETRQAFDSVAIEYDGPGGNNLLVQQMRSVLWRSLQSQVPAGGSILDLGCGTGLDAVYFAQQGYRVTAIDLSEAMVVQTRQRAEQAAEAGGVKTLQLGIQELEQLQTGCFDAIYSDLGALNCLPGLERLAHNCAGLLNPGGLLIFSVIGRYCPWELAYYGLRLDFKRARVRYATEQTAVSLNHFTVWTRYYTPQEFYASFAPFFDWRGCRALNLFLPPPYLAGLYQRHPRFFRWLAWLDDKTGELPLFNRAGDHFLLTMSRRA
jgi:SAM-dependent methyltransferase